MKEKLRSGIFLSITVLLLTAVVLLDAIPNHRYMYGDWDMWLVLTAFPFLFFFHGILSGVLLKRFGSVLYFTVTPAGTFMVFMSIRLFWDRCDLWSSLLGAFLGTILYFAVSFVGFGIVHAVKKAFLAFFDYEKDHRERKRS